MPIHLERIAAILEAANQILSRENRLRETVNHACYMAATNRQTPQQSIDEIYTHLKVTPAYHPAEAVIREETMRYRLTYKRSLAERQRMRARRAGIPFIAPQSRHANPPLPTNSETTFPGISTEDYQPKPIPKPAKDSNVIPDPNILTRIQQDDEEQQFYDFDLPTDNPALPDEDPLSGFDQESRMTPEEKANYEATMRAMGFKDKEEE